MVSYGPSGTGTGTGTFTVRPAIQGHALVPAGFAVGVAQYRVHREHLSSGHLDHVHVQVPGRHVVEDGEARGDATHFIDDDHARLERAARCWGGVAARGA